MALRDLGSLAGQFKLQRPAPDPVTFLADWKTITGDQILKRGNKLQQHLINLAWTCIYSGHWVLTSCWSGPRQTQEQELTLTSRSLIRRFT
jgi:hypothetical protein